MTPPAPDTHHPDRLALRGMRFSGRHGVHPEEKVTPQAFEVDLVLYADLSRAAGSDELADTVDYSPLYLVVRSIVEGRTFHLIEALAGSIADAVLAGTDPALVGAVKVRVRKPEVDLGGELEAVEAALLRRRRR